MAMRKCLWCGRLKFSGTGCPYCSRLERFMGIVLGAALFLLACGLIYGIFQAATNLP